MPLASGCDGSNAARRKSAAATADKLTILTQIDAHYTGLKKNTIYTINSHIITFQLQSVQ